MTEAHTARAHAKLAPSAAHRWLNCAGSVRMEAGMPDQKSTYANEGTAAHEVAAHCLSYNIPPETMFGAIVDLDHPTQRFHHNGESDGVTRFVVNEEMVDAVQVYLDHVYSLIPSNGHHELDIEQRLDMRHLHPELFGTGDAVVYVPHAAHLHVIDFKYGKGLVVEVTENAQLFLYAAGAARRYHNRPVEKITLHIVQPRAPHRLGPVRSWTTDLLTLLEFENVLERLAAATDGADAPLVAGDWCRFCKAAPVCPALRERAKKAALAEFSDDATVSLTRHPNGLSPAELAGVLMEAELIGNWLKAVQEYAHAEAVAGRGPTGFKLVPKRAIRKWRDAKEAEDQLIVRSMLAYDDIFTEPKLKSPAVIERMVGKKNYLEFRFDDLVVKQSSGTNLVPESDPRPAVKSDGMSEFS